MKRKKIAEKVKISLGDIEYKTDIYRNKKGNLELGNIPKCPLYIEMIGYEIDISTKNFY